MQTWVECQARKRAKNFIILCLMGFGITGFLLYLNADYWRVFFHGPPQGNAEALSRDAAAATAYQSFPDPYLVISGDAIEDTGVYYTKSEILKTTTTKYYFLKTQDRILIVEDSKKTRLEPPSQCVRGLSEDLKGKLFPDGTDAAPVNQTYPLVLNTDYKSDGWVAIFWVAIVNVPLVLIAYVYAVRLLGWKVFRNKYKDQGVGRSVAPCSADENQYINQPTPLKGKTWTITRDYVVQNALFLLISIALMNLICAYKLVT